MQKSNIAAPKRPAAGSLNREVAENEKSDLLFEYVALKVFVYTLSRGIQ